MIVLSSICSPLPCIQRNYCSSSLPVSISVTEGVCVTCYTQCEIVGLPIQLSGGRRQLGSMALCYAIDCQGYGTHGSMAVGHKFSVRRVTVTKNDAKTNTPTRSCKHEKEKKGNSVRHVLSNVVISRRSWSRPMAS